MGIFDDIDNATSDALSFVLSPIRSLLRKGARVVASWALGIFHLVGGAWDGMVSGAWSLLGGLESFTGSVINGIGRLVHVYLPELLHWAARNINRVEGLATGFFATLWREVGRAETLAAEALSSGLRWVEHNLIDPLIGRVLAIEHDIASVIGPAVDLLLHPGRLVATVGEWVLSHVLDTLDALGGPILRWVRRSAVHDAKTVAQEIEHLIASVL